MNFFTGIRTFQEWNRYRYGVFPEIGFKNDPLYPYYWQVGPQKVKNEGCNTTFSFEDYNNTENVRLMVRLLEPILVRFSPLKMVEALQLHSLEFWSICGQLFTILF